MKVKRGAQAVEQAGRAAIARAAVSGPPRDEYGELASVKREAARIAAGDLGHELGRWVRRVYAPNTAATVYCRKCRLAGSINLEHSTAPMGPIVRSTCNGGLS